MPTACSSDIAINKMKERDAYSVNAGLCEEVPAEHAYMGLWRKSTRSDEDSEETPSAAYGSRLAI
jgi:hypothetical protein